MAEITTENCKESLSNRLCGIPCEWRTQLISVLCQIATDAPIDCDRVKECETLTSISEFGVEDNEICITYTDEAGVETQRCFTIPELGEITADNALIMSTATNVQLGEPTAPGAPLLHNSFVDADLFTLTMTGTTSSPNGVLRITQTGSGNRNAITASTTGGSALVGVSSTGSAISGTSNTGKGLLAQSVSNNAIQGISQSTSLAAANFQNLVANTTSIIPVLNLIRSTTGVAANGIGQSIDFNLSSTVATRLSNQIVSKWLIASDTPRTSEMIINGVSSGTIQSLLTLSGTGAGQLNQYGLGNFTGTTAFILGVDSSGNIIETTVDDNEIVITADNGLSKNTATNVQLGSASLTGAPLLHDSYISGAFNLALQDGSISVGSSTPILAKITGKTTSISDFFAIIGTKQNNAGGSTGQGLGIDGQFIITGGTTYNGNGPFGGLYGELGFQGSGSWTYAGAAKYVQLGGLSGVTTIYTVDNSDYNSGNSIFSGGQYFVNVAGTGNIDKFASLRALYPITTPGLSYNGTITDHYGLFIDDHTNGGHAAKITNRWGVYQEGEGETNFFAGPMILNLGDFADDTAAAVGLVPLNGLYRTGSLVKIRVGV